MAAKPAAVDPQEFNRSVQKIDLAKEDSIKAGVKGMKFQGVFDVGAGGLILTRCCRSAPERMTCNTVRVDQNDARGQGHFWRV
jgi:hypothetical protein